jgi:hypothetical protein
MKIHGIFSSILLLVSFFFSSGYAQPSSIWLGAHAGADMGTIATGPPDALGTITSKTGIAFGAEAGYWITDNLGMSIGLAYVQKGFNSNLNDGSFGIAYRYLQMPLLLKATFGIGTVKPYFFAGPEIGLKLSATQSGPILGRDTTIDVPDSVITKFNIGILLGAGVTYAINPETMLFLEAGYDHGLSNITPSDKFVAISTRDIRASLGILFRIE